MRTALVNPFAKSSRVVWVFVLGVVAILVASGWIGPGAGSGPTFAQSQTPLGLPTGEHLIALALPPAETHQGIVIVDPVERVLSVYHIDLASGSVRLQSVRRIRYDLQMSVYNGEEPLPEQIRAMVESSN